MFQLEAIDAGGIGLFDIVVIVVIIELIDDADAEGIGVCEATIVDPCHVEVFGISEVAFSLEDGVYLHEPFADEIPMTHIVQGRFPQGVLIVFVFEGHGIRDVLVKIAVRNGQPDFAAMVCEVMAQGLGNWEDGLFPGRFVGLAGRKRKRIDELHAREMFD